MNVKILKRINSVTNNQIRGESMYSDGKYPMRKYFKLLKFIKIF